MLGKGPPNLVHRNQSDSDANTTLLVPQLIEERGMHPGRGI